MNALFSFWDCFPFSSEIDAGDNWNDENFRVLTSDELKSATHNFRSSNKVGQGGFGSVYKGRLQDGTTVAVKTLSIEIESMRGEREFIAELAALSSIRHENLVRLIGCCVDGGNRYLVYCYMKNNSLIHSFIDQISMDVARAIAFLHEEVDPHIVHRDMKASNILDQKLQILV